MGPREVDGKKGAGAEKSACEGTKGTWRAEGLRLCPALLGRWVL